MADYIEREQARQVICGWCEYDSCLADDYYWNKCDAKRRLGDIPAADVQPVVYGHWKSEDKMFGNIPFKCSNCGYLTRETTDGSVLGKPKFNYCPICGARLVNDDV